MGFFAATGLRRAGARLGVELLDLLAASGRIDAGGRDDLLVLIDLGHVLGLRLLDIDVRDLGSLGDDDRLFGGRLGDARRGHGHAILEAAVLRRDPCRGQSARRWR